MIPMFLPHCLFLSRVLVPRHANGDAHLDDEVDLKQTWKAVSGGTPIHV